MSYDPDFDFKGNADRLLMAMRLIAESVDLDKLLATTSMAHTVGPFIDPTTYRHALGKGDMARVESLARALQPAVTVWNEQIAPILPDAEPRRSIA